MAWYTTLMAFRKDNFKKISILAGSVGVRYIGYKILYPKKQRYLWREEWKRDIVYLHVFPRNLAKCVPNMSPYAIKLETWLRINKIPYELIDYLGMSKKGQSPFILFNGEEIPDSNFIVEFLSGYFNVDSGLSEKDEAVARAFQLMVEDHTKWTIFWYQLADHTRYEYIHYLRIPSSIFYRILINCISKHVRLSAYLHGIGRNTSDEIYKISCDDIRALSKFLGDKKYMMGDKPNVVDCTVFGFLSQIAYIPLNYPQRKTLDEEPNIIRYLERIKTTYWKDWDEQYV